MKTPTGYNRVKGFATLRAFPRISCAQLKNEKSNGRTVMKNRVFGNNIILLTVSLRWKKISFGIADPVPKVGKLSDESEWPDGSP